MQCEITLNVLTITIQLPFSLLPLVIAHFTMCVMIAYAASIYVIERLHGTIRVNRLPKDKTVNDEIPQPISPTLSGWENYKPVESWEKAAREVERKISIFPRQRFEGDFDTNSERNPMEEEEDT